MNNTATHIASFILVLLSCFGCAKLDNLEEKVNDLENRVTTIEELCSRMNANITSLQAIVSALQSNNFITDVSPMIEDGVEKGYIITFDNGETITIYHGKDGEDGVTPIIGVRQDIDGEYYWTVNGEWLIVDGKKVKAAGTDGENGEDGKYGITPLLRIENGRWLLSIDNGITWTDIGQATSQDGIFAAVTEDDNNVYFYLTDGSVITLPKIDSSEFGISFSATDIVMSNGGGTCQISYTITDATPTTLVRAIAKDGWRVVVAQDSPSGGTIYITAPEQIVDSEILVFAYDGSYRTVMAIINCFRGTIITTDISYTVPAEGGTLDITLNTNINYTIDIPENIDWISRIDTKSAWRNETVSFAITENDGMPRFTSIEFKDELGNTHSTVVVRQGSNLKAEIPDVAFKQYLTDNFDLDGDGEISYDEAWEVTQISVYSDNISSLQGIENFINLNYLKAVPRNNGCNITGVGDGGVIDSGYWRDSGYQLNGSRVTGQIASLDLSKNLNLTYLDCSGNIIESLDLSNNSLLEEIDASFNLDLNSIVFPEKNIIKYLKLTSTSLESIDVSNMPELISLSINTGLGISSIDVSKNKNLQTLNVQGNKLNSLDVSNNPELSSLFCGINKLHTLDVSNNPKLYDLDFAFNNISEIDLSHNPEIYNLIFQNNLISQIDISQLHNLNVIHFGNYRKASDGSIPVNTITDIDLSYNLNLEHLFATLLDIKQVDITKNTALKRLFIEYSLLTSLDVSNNHTLEELYCYGSPDLSTIYVSPGQSFLYSKDEWTDFKYVGDTDFYESSDYSADGKVRTLQTASRGNGIDIVIMGDGYSDRLIANGTYDSTMDSAAEKFFSVEPYKTFRDMFNVSIVTAVSRNEEFALGTETAFSGYFGSGTAIQGNDQAVFDYAQKAIPIERMNEALILVIMNSDKYAGTCYMYYPTSGDYGNGTSIAYIPTGADEKAFEEVLLHEAGGHGFAKLADEYGYEDMHGIPDYVRSGYENEEQYGWWRNVDFTNDPKSIKWNMFLSDARYADEGLGVFEGGLTYWTGVYRPSETSIMRYNTGGFNAPSREAIYYRIHKLAYGESWSYDYEDFVYYDAINLNTTNEKSIRTSIPSGIELLPSPVVIKQPWYKAKNNAPVKTTQKATKPITGLSEAPRSSNRVIMLNEKETISESGMRSCTK